eukprot:gene3508-1893_t
MVNYPIQQCGSVCGAITILMAAVFVHAPTYLQNVMQSEGLVSGLESQFTFNDAKDIEIDDDEDLSDLTAISDAFTVKLQKKDCTKPQ